MEPPLWQVMVDGKRVEGRLTLPEARNMRDELRKGLGNEKVWISIDRVGHD